MLDKVPQIAKSMPNFVAWHTETPNMGAPELSPKMLTFPPLAKQLSQEKGRNAGRAPLSLSPNKVGFLTFRGSFFVSRVVAPSGMGVFYERYVISTHGNISRDHCE